MEKIVVAPSDVPEIVPYPASTKPMIHMSPPMPGEYTGLVSGRGIRANEAAPPCRWHEAEEQYQLLNRKM